MKIDVSHIARLAHLRFSERELEVIENDMIELAEMVRVLPYDIDTDITEDKGVMELRQDKAGTSCFGSEDVFRNAPKVQSECFVVPKTVQ